MKDKSDCYWFFVPDDKFMHYWSDNVVFFEWAEYEEGEEDGWIFYIHK